MKIENEKKNIDFLSFSIQKHLVTLFGFEEEHIVLQDRHQPQARVEKGTFESSKRSKHQKKNRLSKGQVVLFPNGTFTRRAQQGWNCLKGNY